MYIGNRHHYYLMSAAELIGIDYDTLLKRNQDRLIKTQRVRGDYRVTDKEMRRFVTTFECWVSVHPRDVADPELRQIALTAWRSQGSPAWYTTADLSHRYHPHTVRTIKNWRDNGWMTGYWRWIGKERGTFWLVWAGALPPAPYWPRYIEASRLTGMALRKPIVEAVLSMGGPPGRGRDGFWRKVAETTGCNPGVAQKRWKAALKYGEVPQQSTERSQ